MKSIQRILIAFTGLLLIGMGQSALALTLPNVSNCGYPAPYDNLQCYTTETGAEVYVASEHDEWISYSANAMQQLTNDFGYASLSDWSSLPSQGSGQLVKLFSFNNSNNSGFPDATGGTNDNDNDGDPTTDDGTAFHDTLYFGEWPDDPNTKVTVQMLLDYLGGETSPVLVYDLNDDLLFISGVLEIYDDQTDGLVDQFAFDNNFNGVWDSGQTDAVVATDEAVSIWYDPANATAGCTGNDITFTAQGPINVPDGSIDDGWCVMEVNNNVGSGKPDFYGYSPYLDLSQYDPNDYLLFTLKFWDLQSGGEELSLQLVVAPPNEVPEPSPLFLMAVGLLGVGLVCKRHYHT